MGIRFVALANSGWSNEFDLNNLARVFLCILTDAANDFRMGVRKICRQVCGSELTLFITNVPTTSTSRSFHSLHAGGWGSTCAHIYIGSFPHNHTTRTCMLYKSRSSPPRSEAASCDIYDAIAQHAEKNP